MTTSGSMPACLQNLPCSGTRIVMSASTCSRDIPASSSAIHSAEAARPLASVSGKQPNAVAPTPATAASMFIYYIFCSGAVSEATIAPSRDAEKEPQMAAAKESRMPEEREPQMALDAGPGKARRPRLDRRNIGRDVAEHIRRLILDGTLKPNEKIPQDEVAGELGVSRIPVREALLTLAADGFVVLEPYRGAFVAPLERADIRDQFELYGLIHGFAASRAVAVITEETLQRLDEIHAEFEQL